jgi:predicted CopG family antitoxin
MPYKRAVKVSDKVYRALEELKSQLGVDSANKALEELLVERSERALKLLGVTPSVAHRVTPSRVESAVEKEKPLKVKVEMLSGHPWGFWRVQVGEGYDAAVFALPRATLEAMCRKGLLHPGICEALHEAIERGGG